MTTDLDLIALLDCLDEGVAILDRDARVSYANAVLEGWLAGATGGTRRLAGRRLVDAARAAGPALEEILRRASGPEREAAGEVTLESGDVRVRVTGTATGAVLVAREIIGAGRGADPEAGTGWRRQTELALAASVDGLWSWDLVSGDTWVSPAFTRMLGYEPEEFGASHAGYMERIHEEDRGRVEFALAEHLSRERPYRAEYRIRHRDGAWRWHVTRGISVRDRDGKAVRMAGVTTDVTEWRQTEQALRESEARFRILAAGASLGILLANVAGRVVYANPCLLAMFEAGFEQLLDGTYLDRIHPLDRERVDRSWADAVGTAAETIQQYRLVGADGRVRWVERRTAPIRGDDRDLIGHIGLVTDVTEQHEARAALEASENRFRTLAEESPIGIYQIGSDGVPEYLNPAARHILGVDLDTPVDNFFARVHPDDQPVMRERLDGLLEPGTMGEAEFRLTRPDGDVRWIRARAAAVRAPDGRIAGRIGTLADVTESRAADLARREIEQRIQHAQKLESLGVLAGGIAHDFNNLLVGILGNANLAMLDLPDGSPAHERVLQIQAAAERSADLTRQLLAYAGKGQFEIARVHLARLIDDVLPLLKAALSRRVELRCAFERGLPDVEGDPAQLTQVVMNLLTNASDAIGDRPGVVEIRTSARDLARDDLSGMSLGAELPAGRYAGIVVEDTGVGMDAATLGRIFEPFFTTKFTGRGLGLAAVLGIVRGHHGALHVTSSPGSGTRFEIWLPVPEAADVATAPVRREAAPQEASGLVLVADDEPAVRLVARKFLARWGYEVVEAADGLDALATAEREADRLRLVLLDITMPRKDGVEAFRELRQVDRTLPVVLMSGFTEQSAATDLGSFGRAVFIQKPFKGDDLRRAVAQAIQESGG